jgi:hypothetical protein
MARFWNQPVSMFEGVDEELLGQAIKAKMLEVFGHYPILDISERLEYYDDETPMVLRDYHVLLDTEKLDSITYGLWYVDGLLEEVIRAKLAGKKDLDTRSSKKYCFSDTESWWTAMEIDQIPGGREVFTLRVELA